MASEAKNLLNSLRQQTGARGQLDTLRSQPEPVSGGTAFKRGLLERVAGNIAGVPELLLEGSGLLGNRPPAPVERINQSRLSPQIDLPRVGGQEALAGILGGARSAGNLLQGEPANFGQNFQSSLGESQRTRQDQPFMSGAGGVAGDALSILAGRAPATRLGAGRSAKATTDILAPRIRRGIEKAFRSKAADKISRIAGRSLEGGFEGATLAMLQDGDPVETGAFAAGGQLAGLGGLKLSEVSGLSDLFRGRLIKGGAKLGATALAVGSLFQVAKSTIPGGRDFILESIEAGFDKIPLAVSLGAISGLTGAGRLKGGQLPIVKAELPGVIMDAFSTLPRGATISLLRDALNDETGASEKAINTIITNPESLTESQLKVLRKGIEEGKISEPVRELLEKDERFAQIINAPDPRLADVPVKEDE